MALNFPASPSNNQEYVAPNGVTYIYDAAAGLWYVKTSDAIGTSDINDSAITTAKIADDAVTGDKLANDITISTTGNVSAGNIILPDAGGITFGTTFGAGGGTSKVLDDYEEGTFTPYLRGDSGNAWTTGTPNSARYVKIGKVVHVFGYVTWTKPASTGGVVRWFGLPFPAMSAGEAAPFIDYSGNLSIEAIRLQSDVNNTHFRINGSSVGVSTFPSSGSFQFNFSYDTP